MKLYFPLILLLLFIVAACSPAPDSAATVPPTPESSIKVDEVPENGIDQPAVSPTEVAPTEAPTESLDDPTATPVIEPTEEPTAEPIATIVLTPEEEVVFNGPYENTYFRGSATAPVTLIDYSDFL